MAKWIEDPQGRLEVEKVTEELKLPVWKPSYKGKFREFWNECWEKIENAYLKLKKSIDGKEPAITKKSGFNLEKTDSFEEDDTNKLATAKALKSLHDEVDKKTGAIKWDSITDKPSSFPPSEHNHNSLYYTEDEVDEKLENNILYSTGKTYGGVLNEIGLKEAGKTYFDKNTKKLYLCKNNNTDISANINNYIAMDSNSLLERLENLSKIREITLTKDLDRDLFSRYIGRIPSDISSSKIINVILEEGSGAPGGYSIYGNTIVTFYFNYQITATRKAKIIYY